MSNDRFSLERRVPYFMIENSLIDNGNLSIYEISVYVALCRYANNNTNECYPSLKTISEKLSISKPTVLKYLDSLITKGYISKKQNINQNSYNNNVYTIHGVVNEVDQGSKGDLPPLVNEVDQGSKGDLLYKDSSKKTHKKNTNNIVEIKDTPEELFERLWLLYPLRKGKAAISLKTKKKIFKIGEDHFIRCITRYKYYVTERRNTFSALNYLNGSTFFNSGHVDYLDENYEEVITALPQDKNDGITKINNAVGDSNREWLEGDQNA